MKIAADILSATILFAVPLMLVALGGMFSERSGVINIALEGIMIVGALISCLALAAFDASGFGPTHPQLAEEMNASDVFVLPSFYEGLPLVLIEAMACGIRAICTDLPGIRPWLNRAVPGNGVLFVEPPEMRNEDEATPESLPAFERRLAAAIQTVSFSRLPDQEKVRSVSWDALCEKLCHIWQNC